MNDITRSSILNDYSKQYPLYEEFTNKLEQLIIDLIRANDLRIYSSHFRVKEKDSLEIKLSRSDKKYESLKDITDICGIRIISYFADEVDEIAKIIENEFEIDNHSSIDKRKLLDPDRFGYLSMHYIVKLSAERLQLTEYKKFKDCKAEIQIRSILQHTWAEIEHDLGYKSKQAIPKEIQRSFFRLAGLLEIADAEFVKIRHKLSEYEKKVPEEIKKDPANVHINRASLKSLIKENKLIAEIEAELARTLGAELIKNEFSIDLSVEMIINKLTYLDINSIEDLIRSLEKYKKIIVLFVQDWVKGKKYDTLNAGISLFYLANILVGSTESYETVYKYIEDNDIGSPDERASIAKELISLYQKLTT